MAKQSELSVSQYLAQLSEPGRRVLKEALAAVAKAVPRAESVISYQIPAFKLDGRVLVYLAAWKAHYSLYPVTVGMLAKLGREIARYRDGKGTLRFAFDAPIPRRFLARIAKVRAEEVAAAAALRASKRKSAKAVKAPATAKAVKAPAKAKPVRPAKRTKAASKARR